jgi:CBS domain containing-hemolysin-like protein
MGDLFGVLLIVVLLAANAFFVGSEFALISARRDRLEALAEQGQKSAVTVIRASENLSLMLAGAQLGITICSILLGRIGEPAVAHLLEKPFGLVGIPEAVLHTVSFFVALAIVVTLHVLLGEMVPKNIAIAGPEKAAMLLIPAYLVYIRAVRPFIAFYNWCANITLRAFRVEPRDELDVTVSTVELSEMIAESLSEGLLDPEEHLRLTRALQIRNRVVNDVAVPLGAIRAVPVAAEGSGPTVAAIQRALAETGYSRFPVADLSGEFIGFPHQGHAPADQRPRRRPGRLDGASIAAGARVAAAARRAVAAAPQQQPPGPRHRRRSQRDRDGGTRGPGRRPGRHRARRDPPCLTRHRRGPFLSM